jgi:hypothetical protein
VPSDVLKYDWHTYCVVIVVIAAGLHNVSPATTTIVTAFAVESVLTTHTFLPYAESDSGSVIVTPADVASTRTMIGANSRDVAVDTFMNATSAGTALGRMLYESKFCSIITELCAGSVPNTGTDTP